MSPGRHVLQDSVVFVYVSLSGKDTRQVAAPMASVVRAALPGSLRKNIRGRRPSLPCPATSDCSAGTGLAHQHLQIWLLHTSHILGFLHSPVLFVNFPDTRVNPTEGDLSLTLSHWPLSSKSRERSLCPVRYLASRIIVVSSFDGTCILSHNANLRAPSRTLTTWSVHDRLCFKTNVLEHSVLFQKNPDARRVACSTGRPSPSLSSFGCSCITSKSSTTYLPLNPENHCAVAHGTLCARTSISLSFEVQGSPFPCRGKRRGGARTMACKQTLLAMH